MKTSLRVVALASVVAMCAGPMAWAQEGGQPADGKGAASDAVRPAQQKPIVKLGPENDPNTKPVRRPLPEIKDSEVAALVKLLEGTFKTTPATADDPELHYSAARVDIEGLDNGVYFEISRGDDARVPFRQGVISFYKQASQYRMRVMDLPSQSLADSVVGLWAAPDVFPPLTPDMMSTNLDIEVKKVGDGWAGTTDRRFPTTRGGAWFMDSGVGLRPGEVSFNERGYDQTGTAVFGTKDGRPLVFKRFDSPIKARRLEGGLVSIDLVPPDEKLPKAQDGVIMSVHYSGWLVDGRQFGTSREGDPQQIRIPANFITGWKLGIPGMTKGTVRRLWVPSGLAFGASGERSFKIPSNAALIFEVECLYLADDKPEPGPEPEKVEAPPPMK